MCVPRNNFRLVQNSSCISGEVVLSATSLERCLVAYQVSKEISNLSEVSGQLLFVSYFASQSERINFGDLYFDVCCENKNFWLDTR